MVIVALDVATRQFTLARNATTCSFNSIDFSNNIFLFDFLFIANTFQDLAYNFVEKEWNQRPCRDKVCRK